MEELKIERDAPVFVANREVGRVTHVIVDPQTKEVTEVVVAHDGRESTVPITAVVGAGGGAIRLRDTAGAALGGDFVRGDFHGVDDRTADAEKAEHAMHGGAPLRDAEDDAVTIGQVASAMMPPPATPATKDQPARQPAARATAHEDTVTVPVAEERLMVGTRAVELGEIEVRKTVAEEQVSVPVTLRREEVTVQERDIKDRPLHAGEEAF